MQINLTVGFAVLAALLAIFSWSAYQKNEVLEARLSQYQSLVQANNALVTQNKRVAKLGDEAAAANAKASGVLELLPVQIEADKVTGVQPAEMNEWLDNLCR